MKGGFEQRRADVAPFQTAIVEHPGSSFCSSSLVTVGENRGTRKREESTGKARERSQSTSRKEGPEISGTSSFLVPHSLSFSRSQCCSPFPDFSSLSVSLVYAGRYAARDTLQGALRQVELYDVVAELSDVARQREARLVVAEVDVAF